MNHHGLFIKLMERRVPNELLNLLENWFSLGETCIKWGSYYSNFFRLSCGIKQGGVLSPHLFAVYIDSISSKVQQCGTGCFVKSTSVSMLLYADDILLLSPSVSSLQQLLHVCKRELQILDMPINVKKSMCMRIGPRSNNLCKSIVTLGGHELVWAAEIRHLGTYLLSSRTFCCSVKNNKKSFYRAFNALFGKIGRTASEEVVIELFKAKCLPILYYGSEAYPLNKSQMSSLQFAINGCFGKIFDTKSSDILDACMEAFDFPSVEQSINLR
jgi:hypothetical protein